MKVQRCKGMRDLTPEEMTRFRLIEGTFRESCRQWGYQEVKTPTVEYLHLFTSAGTLTPSMLSKVYSFLDWDGWSGERVVLRPDGTIPIARMYIESMAEKGFARLCYVTNSFIFEETGKKNRERWQCGAELIGAGSPQADTELISLASEVLRKLKFDDAELRLSHAGLIKSLLARLELSSEEQTAVFDQVLDGNAEALAKVKSKRPGLEAVLLPLLSLKGQSSGFLKNLKAVARKNVPEAESYFNDFIGIVELLEALECRFQIDVASGAGFEYYTGVIFQFFIGGVKVGGGGRYDALIPSMGGDSVPASGFALYLDRLMSLMKPEVLAGKAQARVLVKGKNPEAVYDVSCQLRDAGYVAELDLAVKKQSEAQWALNIEDNAFILTNLSSGKKREARTMEEVLRVIRGKR